MGLFITNSSDNFQNTTAVVKGLLDVHKMIVTVCKNYFEKSKPRKIVYRNYKHFDIKTYKNILSLRLQTIKTMDLLSKYFLKH